jgi:hypothetical protein
MHPFKVTVTCGQGTGSAVATLGFLGAVGFFLARRGAERFFMTVGMLQQGFEIRP